MALALLQQQGSPATSLVALGEMAVRIGLKGSPARNVVAQDSMARIMLTVCAAVVYVSGRRRAPGEMNGKSANLNNCMRQIYPEGVPIPLNEMVCIFDADQVANPDFFLKTVPLFDAGDDVGMVLSPQVSHSF